MFFLILFGFYHVFLTGRTAAKNNIQFQPYRSKKLVIISVIRGERILRVIQAELAEVKPFYPYKNI